MKCENCGKDNDFCSGCGRPYQSANEPTIRTMEPLSNFANNPTEQTLNTRPIPIQLGIQVDYLYDNYWSVSIICSGGGPLRLPYAAIELPQPFDMHHMRSGLLGGRINNNPRAPQFQALANAQILPGFAYEVMGMGIMDATKRPKGDFPPLMLHYEVAAMSSENLIVKNKDSVLIPAPNVMA